MRKITRSSGRLRSTRLPAATSQAAARKRASSQSAASSPSAVPVAAAVRPRRTVRPNPRSSSSPQPVAPMAKSDQSIPQYPFGNAAGGDQPPAGAVTERPSLPQLIGADVRSGKPFRLQLIVSAVGIDGPDGLVDLGVKRIALAEHGADALAQHGRIVGARDDDIEIDTLRPAE